MDHVPETMEKGHSSRKLELCMTGLLSGEASLLTLNPSTKEPYFSKTPGFFAVILVPPVHVSTLFSNVSACLLSPCTVSLVLIVAVLDSSVIHTIRTGCIISCHQPRVCTLVL